MRFSKLLPAVALCAGALADEAPPGTTPSATLGDGACFPTDVLKPGSEAPCVKVPLLSYECVHGTPLASIASEGTAAPKETSKASPKDVQKCYCNKGGAGEFVWQYMDGCANCLKLHGAAQAGRHDFASQYFQSRSSEYCALPTPPVFEDFVQSAWAAAPTATGRPSDVLGSATDTSLYFTLSPDYTLPTGSATSSSSLYATGNVTSSQTVANATSSTGSATATGSGPASQSSNAAVALQASGFGIVAILGAAMLL